MADPADDGRVELTRMALIVEALARYPFRPPAPGETLDAYLAAVTAHVASHDWAAAEEIRLGCVQAEWTAAQVQAFTDRMLALPRSHQTPPIDGRFQVSDVESGGMWPVTDKAMHVICDELLTGQLEHRVAHPAQDLPIIAGVLVLTGELILMHVGRRDRIAALRFLAQRAPIYGFVLVFDAFAHVIDHIDGKAQKLDCLIGHLGTRTVRVMKRRPYRYVDNRRRVVVDPALADIDVRDPTTTIEDPYADIFVSVPLSTARPS
jgi:hypothetical protein